MLLQYIKFQGNEKSCIIFDLVEGLPLSPGRLTRGDFSSEQGRLINVAISRAKGIFILVGNRNYIRAKFTPNDAIYQIMEKINKIGGKIESVDILSTSFEKASTKYKKSDDAKQLFEAQFSFLDENNFYQKFQEDLNRAKSSVLIFSPFIAQRRLKSLLDDLKSAIRKKINITIVTRHPDHQGGNRQTARKLIETLEEMGVNVIIASNKTG